MSWVSVTRCNFPPSSQDDSLVNLVSSKQVALEPCYCRSLTAKESRGQVRASPEQRVLFSQKLELAEGQWGLCASFKIDERWRSTWVTMSEGKRKEGVPQLTRQSRRPVYLSPYRPWFISTQQGCNGDIYKSLSSAFFLLPISAFTTNQSSFIAILFSIIFIFIFIWNIIQLQLKY